MKRYIKSSSNSDILVSETYNNSMLPELSASDIQEYFHDCATRPHPYVGSLGHHIPRYSYEKYLPSSAMKLSVGDYDILAPYDILIAYDSYWENFRIFQCDPRNPSSRCEDACHTGFSLHFDDTYSRVCIERKGSVLCPVYLIR